MLATPDHLTAAFRFDRKAGHRLREIAHQLRQLSPEQRAGMDLDLSFFDKAADSAEQGEPLIVRFTKREEIEQMAQHFTNLGLQGPAIDELN